MDAREEENNLNEDSALLSSCSSFCPQSSKLIVIEEKAITGLLYWCAAGTGFLFCFFPGQNSRRTRHNGGSIIKYGREATLKQSSRERNNLKLQTLRYFFKTALLLSIPGVSFAAH